MNHLVLLGDSIFDNEAYTGKGKDLRSQLQQQDWKVTLLAVDGNTTQDMPKQITQVPSDTTHLVISIGGNDALSAMGLLDSQVKTLTEAFVLIGTVIAGFHERYEAMLKPILNQRYTITLSTIYYPRIPEPELQKVAVTALAFFNDVIVAQAIQHNLPLLDLRFICNEDADFANPIEPSAAGSAKIAAAIQRVISDHDFSHGHTEVFV